MYWAISSELYFFAVSPLHIFELSLSFIHELYDMLYGVFSVFVTLVALLMVALMWGFLKKIPIFNSPVFVDTSKFIPIKSVTKVYNKK